MKRSFAILLALTLVLTLLTAFSGVATNTSLTAPQKIIQVHNVSEFCKALKSNVTIKLMPGEYNMEEVVKTKYSLYNKKYFGCYSVTGAMLKNLKNVRIYADSNVLMYTSQESGGISYDDVLILNNCKNITFENITFGHKSKTKDSKLACLAGVIALYKCEKIEVENCDLFGCGYTGFNMEKSKDITVRDCKIHDCETSAFWMTGCKNVSFINTEIYNNGIGNTWCKLGELVDCTDTRLTSCTIKNNGCEGNSSGALFNIVGTAAQPVLDQCVLENNKY